MATKKKNIPALDYLKDNFIYVDATTMGGAIASHAGKLMPKHLFEGRSIAFVRAILTEGEDLYSTVINASRHIKIQSSRMPEDKLVWYYHTGKYPQNVMDHIDGDLLNSRIENLKLSKAVHKSKTLILKNKMIQAGRGDAANELKISGVVGIYYTTSQYNAYTWKVEYIKNTVKEVPCDGDGVPLSSWGAKGWHKRKTKLVRHREKTFIGFYLTLDEAKRALRLHTNEVEHAICRWHTDAKIKALCQMICATKGGVHEGVWEYVKMLSFRKVLPEHEVSALADALGYENRALPVSE